MISKTVPSPERRNDGAAKIHVVKYDSHFVNPAIMCTVSVLSVSSYGKVGDVVFKSVHILIFQLIFPFLLRITAFIFKLDRVRMCKKIIPRFI